MITKKTDWDVKNYNPKITKFFDSLSNETRLRIVTILSKKPLTVNDLLIELNNSLKFSKQQISLSGLSHQLKILSDSEVIIMDRFGREKYCKLSENFCWCIVKDAFTHFNGKTKCPKCCKS